MITPQVAVAHSAFLQINSRLLVYQGLDLVCFLDAILLQRHISPDVE